MALPTKLNVSPQDLGDLHADLYGTPTRSPVMPGMDLSPEDPQTVSSGKYSGKYSRAGRSRRGPQASRLQRGSHAGVSTPQSASAARSVDAEGLEGDDLDDDAGEIPAEHPSSYRVRQFVAEYAYLIREQGLEYLLHFHLQVWKHVLQQSTADAQSSVACSIFEC